MDENKIILNEADKAGLLTLFEAAMSREERHSRRITNVLTLIIVLWFCTVALFVWYITLPIEQSVTEEQTIEDVDNPGEINQTIGK